MPIHKIAHLTSVHPRYDTRIFLKMCTSLAKDSRYKVYLVVADDLPDEEKNGVTIVSVGKTTGGRLSRMTRTVGRVYKKAMELDCDLYHFHDPELLPIGIMLKCKGKKVIYDVHEDVPKQTLSKDYLPVMIRQPLAWTIGAVEWIGAKILDAIVPATPKIAEKFPARKTVTIQNFPIHDELVIVSPAPYQERPAVFVYMGGIERVRGAKEMVRAMEYFRDGSNIRLSLAGDFSSIMLYNELNMLPEWQFVDYHGHVSREQVASLLNSARAGLVLFHPEPNHIDAQPNKLFEYMSAGLPVIASDFPLWRRIIDGAGCGLLVDPLDPAAIAKAMRWILEHPAEAEAMGQRGRKAVEQTYNWGAEAPKLLDLYNKLLKS